MAKRHKTQPGPLGTLVPTAKTKEYLEAAHYIGHSLIQADTVKVLIGNKTVELTADAASGIRDILTEVAQGHQVAVIPLQNELTTQEAADILNVSRPYLVKLLKEGDIPFHMAGSHRRVKARDLLAYKEQQDAEREESLRTLVDISQEYGLYD